MTIPGIDNQKIELKISNYQFPQITDDRWDSNWLLIYLKVNSKVGDWETVDASLTTFEVKKILEWFKDLIENRKLKWNPLDFTEPNLSFEYLKTIDEFKRIRIRFELESRPQSYDENNEYFVDCDLNTY